MHKCRTITILIMLFAVAFASILFFSASAHADNAASDRILIYNQNSGNAAGGSNDGQQACRNLALRGSNTMGGSGCGIYAMAHAYQWLTGDKRSTSDATELLQMFINSNISAGSNAPWEGYLDTKYGSILVNNYSAQRVCWPAEDRIYPVTETDWLSLTQNGGAAILNIHVPNYISGYDENGNPIYYSGHYNCAVEAIRADIDGNGSAELWIHIVDSSAGSTFHRLYKKGQYPAYSVNSHSLISTSTGNGYWRGDEYWVSYAVLRNTMTVVGAYLPSIDEEPPVVTSARITNATPNGYSVVCEAQDNSSVRTFQIGTWNDVIGIDAAHWDELPAANGTATFTIDIADCGSARNTIYHTNVYAIDGSGNVSEGIRAGDIFINDAQRKEVYSGVYVIHSAWNDNICLDIQGDSTGNNANIQLYHRVNSDVQKFRIIKWNENYYCIRSIYNGRWLDVASPIGDNSNVKLFDNNDYDEDYWYFEDAGNGYVYIRNRTGYYLDVQGDRGEDHANIQLYHFVGNESQKWRLEDVTNYFHLVDGIYAVHTGLDNNYRLDISGDSMENRANIQLYEQTDSDVQLFRFTNKGSYYVIQSVYSNKWLDVHMPIGNNANVQLWEDNTAAEEHWTLEDSGDGYVYMRTGRDYYLDVQGSTAKNNANIQVFRFLGEDCQKWKISSDKPNFGKPDFTLPAAVSTVDDSAFEGIAATTVYIPDTCTSIGKWAFKDCANLTRIRIPADCAIGTDAFSGCANVAIYGTKGSAAETYANSHSNCTFVAE